MSRRPRKPPAARQGQIARIRRVLPAWFRRNRRDLPWRRRSDPYAVWVAEVMLQQTRVATAEEYYRRFLEAFPTVRALADAPLDAVLKAWEGLGYYGRARNLHKAARIVADELAGKLPTTAAEVGRLPGVGPYTAGAVASIAFGRREAALDGNVIRVLCRAFRVGADPRLPGVRRRLWKLAGALLPARRVGEFNQALMDLGATVCTPRGPRCPACPIRPACRAAARGEQHRLPRRAAPPKLPHYDVAAAVVFRAGRVLIDRRPDDGLLGGLWEFPGGKVRPGESPADAAVREAREELGVTVEAGEELIVVRQAYSHFRITLHAIQCRYVSGRCKAIGCTAWRWVAPDQLDEYAFPRANRRVIEALCRRRG